MRSARTEADLRGCDVVYFAGGASERWLEKLQGTTVLTLGEDRGFLEAGALVEITCRNDAVQFEVNLDEVRSAGLKIDVRLLELAKSVTRAGGNCFAGCCDDGGWKPNVREALRKPESC